MKTEEAKSAFQALVLAARTFHAQSKQTEFSSEKAGPAETTSKEASDVSVDPEAESSPLLERRSLPEHFPICLTDMSSAVVPAIQSIATLETESASEGETFPNNEVTQTASEGPRLTRAFLTVDQGSEPLSLSALNGRRAVVEREPQNDQWQNSDLKRTGPVQRRHDGQPAPVESNKPDLPPWSTSMAHAAHVVGPGLREPAPGSVDAKQALTQAFRPEIGHLQMAMPGSIKVLKFNLMPEHLGSVEVRVRKMSEGLSISIMADTRDGASRLQAEEGSLRKLLEVAGFDNAASSLVIEYKSVQPADRLISTGQPGAEAFASARDGSASFGMGGHPSTGDAEKNAQSGKDASNELEERDAKEAVPAVDHRVLAGRRGLYL